MKITEMPLNERPREKLMKFGRDCLSTSELIAIIVGNGSKNRSAIEVGMNLVGRCKEGISELADATPEELMKTGGIGQATACRILAAMELGRRAATEQPLEKEFITSSKEVAELYMEKMKRYKKEYLISLLMSLRGEIIEEVTVSVGDLCSSISHPREVFVNAVRRSAGAIILIHNHPSGNPRPSDEDILTTKRLMEVGELMGIPVIDHIIVGDGAYCSMKDDGLFDAIRGLN